MSNGHNLYFKIVDMLYFILGVGFTALVFMLIGFRQIRKSKKRDIEIVLYKDISDEEAKVLITSLDSAIGSEKLN